MNVIYSMVILFVFKIKCYDECRIIVHKYMFIKSTTAYQLVNYIHYTQMSINVFNAFSMTEF